MIRLRGGGGQTWQIVLTMRICAERSAGAKVQVPEHYRKLLERLTGLAAGNIEDFLTFRQVLQLTSSG